MFDQKVIISQQFPIAQKARKHTDVCCTFIGALFALSLFITAIIIYAPDQYRQKFSISNMNTCKAGYLHFPDIENNPNNRACLRSCPQGYGTTEDNVCLPYDRKLQQKYFQNTLIIKQKDNEGFIRTLMYSFFVAFGMGILWMVFVFALPKYAPMIAAAGGAFSLSLVLIFTVLSTQNFWGDASAFKLVPIIISTLLIIILVAILFTYTGQLKFQGVLLKYSNIFLFQNTMTFLYIPIFFILTFGLLALIWFQNMAFQSRFASNNNPWSYINSGVFGVLNVLELIWGLQFLRDAFYFCISGNAVDWYWKGKCSTFAPMMRLFCRHWGSVVGGSFLNGFLGIPTLLMELLICHPQACCEKAGTVCVNSCNPLTCFFDIVRTDAYAYINLSGIPFCNSARNCSHVCQKSKQFIGNHSSAKHYRFMALTFLTSLVCFMTQWILNFRTFNINIWYLAIGTIIIYSIITWFVDIHAASAQALQTCYLVEFQLEQGYKYMRKILPSIKGQLKFLDAQVKHDGNC